MGMGWAWDGHGHWTGNECGGRGSTAGLLAWLAGRGDHAMADRPDSLLAEVGRAGGFSDRTLN